mgnify:FL=1
MENINEIKKRLLSEYNPFHEKRKWKILAKKGIFAIIYYDNEHLDRRNCGKERDGKSFKRQRPRDQCREVRKKWKRI